MSVQGNRPFSGPNDVQIPIDCPPRGAHWVTLKSTVIKKEADKSKMKRKLQLVHEPEVGNENRKANEAHLRSSLLLSHMKIEDNSLKLILYDK